MQKTKMKNGFDVFVAIFVIVSSEGSSSQSVIVLDTSGSRALHSVLFAQSRVCMACFSENGYTVFISKTGSQFVKDCLCKEAGYSVHHLTWLDLHGQPIQPHGPDTSTYTNVYTEVQPHNNLVRLTVGSISKAMAGNYTCKTNFEGKTYTKTYKIEAYDSLYFVNATENQYAIMGEDSLIRCEVRSTIEYDVQWYRLDEAESVTLNNNTKYTVLPLAGLVIKNVSKDDSGRYICAAVDMIENDFYEHNITVQVAVRPIISDLRVNIAPDSIVSGDKVTIECVADGTPYPEYFWKKTSDSLGNPLSDASKTWTQVVNTITFENIQKDDAGTYECLADNGVDNDTKIIKIPVQVPPVITLLDNVTAVEGLKTQIICKTTGVPTPRVLISYITEGLDNDPRIYPLAKNTTDTSELYLTIINVSRSFEGIYTCSASNGAGNVTQDMYLTVLYKPYFPNPDETVWGWEGHTVNMSCHHESNPPSTIVWKFQGNEIEHETITAEHVQVNKLLQSGNISGHYLALTVDNMTMYGEYECIVTNDYGVTTKRIHLREAFKPDVIRNATVVYMTARSVTFLIQGPDPTDNAPVHGYTAEYDLVENYDFTSVHPSRTCGLDRNFTIDRLKPNSTYSIKFAAQNEVGIGKWSDTLEFVTPESSAPEPPLLRVHNSEGMIRWSPPEANGAPIDHYSVEFCPFFGEVINTTLCQKLTVASTEFILDTLDRNTKYSFEVRAHNLHGYSDFKYEEVTTPERLIGVGMLSAGAIVGISVVVVFLCLLALDLLLLCWRQQGIIASCFFRKNKKKTDGLHSRDKKSLLVREGERASDSLTSPNNGHRELVYNKTTGVITGKHSSV